MLMSLLLLSIVVLCTLEQAWVQQKMTQFFQQRVLLRQQALNEYPKWVPQMAINPPLVEGHDSSVQFIPDTRHFADHQGIHVYRLEQVCEHEPFGHIRVQGWWVIRK